VQLGAKDLVRQIIHVDMDAFFASVEELLQPSLRGKPIIVGAEPEERGVVATASYAARRYGVRSAMPSRTAARLCPNAVFLPVRKELYREYSEWVMSILKEYTPLVERVSIDEAFLDLTQPDAPFARAGEIGRAIQRRIGAEIGLPCSIGIATNKLVAKVASDLKKPEGFVVVPPGKEREFLAPLAVNKLWGVGPKTNSQLQSMGIHTIGELSTVPQERLLPLFGKRGLLMHLESQGIDERAVQTERAIKSVSREHTFSRDVCDAREIESTNRSLAQSIGIELKKQNLKARTLTIKLRHSDFSTHTYSRTRAEGIDSAGIIFEESLKLLQNHWRPPRRLRLVGIRVSTFISSPLRRDGGQR
jgi:DNA polymerase-4